MLIFDHTEKSWSSRKRKENGAATYSNDIVSFQIKNWQKRYGDNKFVAISTCPKFEKIKQLKKLSAKFFFIQYLHMYPYNNPIGYVLRTRQKTRNRVLFLTAYNSFHVLMSIYNIKSKFIPMSIDKSIIKPYIKPDETKQEKKVIYFGNRYSDKTTLFDELKIRFEANGYQFDWISDGKFNDNLVVSQSEAWEIISTYKYGIGVGRCAMEMWTLGLKVVIAGNQFGGIVMDESDWNVQQKTNFNGRCITFDRDIDVCIKCLPNSLQFPNVKDISEENHAID